MAKIDTYYRAFKDYRNVTKKSTDLLKDRKTLIETNPEMDLLTSTKYICSIEEDWVKAIEEGLEFAQKAIDEERQFIRVNGEIVPIEKVKKVSKSSVEYLAKHANMITHVPDDPKDDIVPDELYITEKLNDYAVYENRFLYMLLRYLEDFIFFRVDKIEKLRATYVGNYSIHKEVSSGKRIITYDTKVYEKREDNLYPVPDKDFEVMLQRVKDCRSIVSALLSTNLMSEVSKSPMIKPPITKTNVLKMNNNFKKCLALYEYISMYKGLGYSFEEVTKEYHPFNESVGDELSDSLLLTSFLTYKIGNDLDDVLETNYQIEERERRELEEKKVLEKIKRIKKKALESKQTLEEYMLLLEHRNQVLEHNQEELISARNEIDKLNKDIDELNLEKEELNRRIEELKETIEEKIQEIAYLNQKYIEDMNELRRKHKEEIDLLNTEHEKEINDLVLRHEEEIEEINLSHDKEVSDMLNNHKIEIQELNEKHLSEIDEINDNYALEKENLTDSYEAKISSLNNKQKDLINDYNSKISDLNSNIDSIKAERKQKIEEYESKIKSMISSYEEIIGGHLDNIKSLTDKNDDLTHLNNLYMGELNAIRVKNGLLSPCDDFASKERFDEITDEYVAFQKFYKDQWKLIKKKIKAEVKESKDEILEEERLKNEEIFNEELEKKKALKEAKKALKEELKHKEKEDVIEEETKEETKEETTTPESQEDIKNEE